MSYVQDLGQFRTTRSFKTQRPSVKAPVKLRAHGGWWKGMAPRQPIVVTAPRRRTATVTYPAPVTNSTAPTTPTASQTVNFAERGIVPPRLVTKRPPRGGIVPPHLQRPVEFPDVEALAPEELVAAEPKKVTSIKKPLIIGGIVIAALGGLYLMRKKR